MSPVETGLTKRVLLEREANAIRGRLIRTVAALEERRHVAKYAKKKAWQLVIRYDLLIAGLAIVSVGALVVHALLAEHRRPFWRPRRLR